jgi:hypothetical protein
MTKWRQYTDIDRYEALMCLKKCDFNYTEANKITGVPIATLREMNNRWDVIEKSAEELHAASHKLQQKTQERLQMHYSDIIEKAAEADNKLLDRINAMLDDEKELKKVSLTQIATVLEKIGNRLDKISTKEEPTGTVNNTQVNNFFDKTEEEMRKAGVIT